MLKEAEESLCPRSSLFGLISTAPDYYAAAEKFNQAGNLYKASSKWASAAEAYLRAADANQKDGHPEEAARRRLAASSCLRKCGEGRRAIELIEEANAVYVRAGRFATVGGNEKECAEIAERDLGDKPLAMEFYKRAAERYLAESSPAYVFGLL